ncbi:MAG: tetratricopeptide repeat protein [Pyrinomonadaceae bacterium]
MAFDKTKLERAAEKHLAQGKIPAAIKEYEQIVREDPNDFTVLNTLGDLYSRTGKKSEAISCFMRIAEHYREQGFNLKAIAVYKKIDRLEPRNPHIALQLGELYSEQGLVVDARAQYLIVSESYTQEGQAEKALEVLRKIADLDPHNTEIRLRLAESYLHENFQPEAAEAFTQAGSQFLARGTFNRALIAFKRAIDLNPYDHAALEGLVTAHIEMGTADAAAEVLERAASKQPDDIKILELLAHVYVVDEDVPAAERTIELLVKQDNANYTRFVDVVRLYLKAGDVDAAVRVLSSVSEQMLSGREEEKLLELVNDVLARDPEQIGGLRLLVRVYWWQRDIDKLRTALERLADASKNAQLQDEERAALTQLARLWPDQPQYHERLRLLGGIAEDISGDSFSFEQRSEEVPTFESFTLVDNNLAEETVDTGATVETTLEFESNTVADAPAAFDPSSSFADLNDALTEETTPVSFSVEEQESAPQSTGFHEFDFESIAAEELAQPLEEKAKTAPPPSTSSTPQTPSSPPATDARREATLRQELESVDFYIAQGYTDIAVDTLNLLERQFGLRPEISERRQRLGPEAVSPIETASPATEAAAEEEIDFAEFTFDSTKQEAASEDEFQVEIDDMFSANMDALQPPVQQREVLIPKPETAASPGIDAGLREVFEEFRNAAEADADPALANGDYETHYNLGLAYKDMALLDEAVEEFQKAAGLAKPQDGTARYLQCCNLLGHCFMQKGMPKLAVMWYKKGLDAPGHSTDEYQALRYELGTAYEQMGELERAIETFTEVYGVNVSYRGVATKLRELQKSREE